MIESRFTVLRLLLVIELVRFRSSSSVFRQPEISLRTLFAHSALLNLESFKVYSLFSYQCSFAILIRFVVAVVLGDSSFTISLSELFVNNFFIYFFHFFWNDLLSTFFSVATTRLGYHLYRFLSTTFLDFFKFFFL